jgi:hypothetical protein
MFDAGILSFRVAFAFPEKKETKGEFERESVVWGKYAPTGDVVHEYGYARETAKRVAKPDYEYAGYISSIAGNVRSIRTRPGHGFEVIHAPLDGLHHAEIGYSIVRGQPFGKNEKNELKLALSQAFSELISRSRL